MRINFGGVKDATDVKELIPEGDYVCRVKKVEESSTKHGDAMWKLRFQVANGDHANRVIFDNLVFSEAGLPRAKLILKRLGFDVSGELEFEPGDLVDKYVMITVEHKTNNKGKLRAEVPFAGYQAVEVAVEDDDEDETPPF
jgi:hypothetical protein